MNMIQMSKMFLVVAVLSQGYVAFSEEVKKGDPANTIAECKTIEDACKGAGYISGQWKVKNGLWANCVKPISNGKDADKLKSTPELAATAKKCLELRPKSQGHKEKQVSKLESKVEAKVEPKVETPVK